MKNLVSAIPVLLAVCFITATAQESDMIQNEAFKRFLTAARAWHEPNDTLDGDYLVDPPEDDYGYFNTPANSLTFLAMGVDGVHTAMLKLDGAVREDSPVIYVSPTDGESEWTILAPTFVDYLADGCAVTTQRIGEPLDTVNSEPEAMMQFLHANFDGLRLLDEHRIRLLNSRYLSLVEKKAEYKEMEARWATRK
jgi:hypothetical protein